METITAVGALTKGSPTCSLWKALVAVDKKFGMVHCIFTQEKDVLCRVTGVVNVKQSCGAKISRLG